MIGTCPTIGATSLVENGSWDFTEIDTGQDQTDFNNANIFDFTGLRAGLWEVDFLATFECFTLPGFTQQSPVVWLEWHRGLENAQINRYNTNPDIGGENSTCPLPVESDEDQVVNVGVGCALCDGSNSFLLRVQVSIGSISDVQAGTWTLSATRIGEG